eukprot:scaffold3540_cov379-Prasinococcus_capsulatus_cf.AAC.17
MRTGLARLPAWGYQVREDSTEHWENYKRVANAEADSRSRELIANMEELMAEQSRNSGTSVQEVINQLTSCIDTYEEAAPASSGKHEHLIVFLVRALQGPVRSILEDRIRAETLAKENALATANAAQRQEAELDLKLQAVTLDAEKLRRSLQSMEEQLHHETTLAAKLNQDVEDSLSRAIKAEALAAEAEANNGHLAARLKQAEANCDELRHQARRQESIAKSAQDACKAGQEDLEEERVRGRRLLQIVQEEREAAKDFRVAAERKQWDTEDMLAKAQDETRAALEAAHAAEAAERAASELARREAANAAAALTKAAKLRRLIEASKRTSTNLGVKVKEWAAEVSLDNRPASVLQGREHPIESSHVVPQAEAAASGASALVSAASAKAAAEALSASNIRPPAESSNQIASIEAHTLGERKLQEQHRVPLLLRQM